MNPFSVLFQHSGDVPAVGPTVLFEVFGLPIANSTLYIFMITFLFAGLGWWVTKQTRSGKGLRPNMLQSGLEAAYEWLVSLIVSIVGDEKKAQPVVPVVLALIFYIAVANVITLVPFLPGLTWNGASLLRAPMADFNTTFGLAFGVVVAFQMIAIMEWGMLGYLGRFFQFKQVYEGFKKGIGAGFMSIIEFIIGLLDIISEGAKVVSLSFRLFGNIFAGEVLLVIIFGAFAYLAPALWMTLSLLFGLIQALVFGALTAAYYASSLKPEEEELVEIGY